MGIRVEAVLEAIEDQPSEEGAFLVLETEMGTASLASIVARICGDDELEKARLYQRMKRVRSRAKRRLFDMIAESRM